MSRVVGEAMDKNNDDFFIQSTTGTSIQTYMNWLENELSKKRYGEVAIRFIITNGQITDVKKESVDKDHFDLRSIK